MAFAVMSSSMVARVVTPASLKRTPARVFARAAAAKRTVAVSRAALTITAEGPEGMEWFPGAVGPTYCDGSMAGDYGFDPLRLGGNPTLLPYYREAELTNGRWAMMAVAGIIFTDAFGLGPWWTAGAQPTAIPFTTLVAVEVAVMAVLESKRIDGWKKTGESGFLSSFPFDPMGMTKDAASKKEMQIKEVKNGRLAMVAFVGMCSQAAVTGMGPIEGLKAHIADPTNVNIYTSAVGGEVTAAIIALSIAPVIIMTQKSLSDDSEEEFRPIPW
jgi:hypothetical protein